MLSTGVPSGQHVLPGWLLKSANARWCASAQVPSKASLHHLSERLTRNVIYVGNLADAADACPSLQKPHNSRAPIRSPCSHHPPKPIDLVDCTRCRRLIAASQFAIAGREMTGLVSKHLS